MRAIIFLYGSTNSKKTFFCSIIARHLSRIIFNLDSRQIYKEISIITNKFNCRKNIDIILRLDRIKRLRKNFGPSEWLKIFSREYQQMTGSKKKLLISSGSSVYISNLMNISRNIYYRYFLYKKSKLYKQTNSKGINMYKVLRTKIIIIKNLIILKNRSINLKKLKENSSLDNKIYIYQETSDSNGDILKKINFMLKTGAIKEVFLFKKINSINNICNIIGLKYIYQYVKKNITHNVMVKNIIGETNIYIKKQNKWMQNKIKHRTRLQYKKISNFYEDNNTCRTK